MKKLALLSALLGLVVNLGFAENIDLGAGKGLHIILPDTWISAEPDSNMSGMPAMGKTVRYVTKDGSNDALLMTIVTVPDDRFSDRENLKALVEESAQQFILGSVEGKADLREFRIGGMSGFSVTFTDAELVDKPSVKDNYKAVTICFVYLGDNLMLNATIFTDDVTGKAYAEGLHILRSVSVKLPKDTI